MMIRGLIFDMDGVLLDTERIYFSCWQKSAAELGYTLKPEYALAVRSCCQNYAESYLKRMLGEEFDYLAVRNRRRELVSQYIVEHGITQKPGIAKLVQYCKNNGIRVAVATATSKELAEERLAMAGLSDIFSVIVGGDQVERGKPAPDIYLTAAQALGLPAEACAAVEDSPNGIAAAFAAGCSPIMVPDLTAPEDCFQPLLLGVAADLEQVIPILQAVSE